MILNKIGQHGIGYPEQVSLESGTAKKGNETLEVVFLERIGILHWLAAQAKNVKAII